MGRTDKRANRLHGVPPRCGVIVCKVDQQTHVRIAGGGCNCGAGECHISILCSAEKT